MLDSIEWPSLKKTGYIYNVESDSNIDDGNFSFTLEKNNNPTITASMENGVISIKETEPLIVEPPVAEEDVGGVLSHSGLYTMHVFYSSGTYNVKSNHNAQVIVVGGGGGGSSGGGGEQED